MFRLAFVAAVETAASCEPGHRPFYDPTVTAQALGGVDAFACDAVGDAAVAEPLPQVAVVIAFVAVELAGLSPSGPTPGADGRDTAYEWLQALTVVHVRSRDADRER